MRQKLQDSILQFVKDPLHPSLRNHQLRGKHKDYRSINVTGDVRVLYLQRDNEVVFDAVGTHNQLYG